MDLLDSYYDCVDRIVLNAYFSLGQSPGGFRCWWRSLMGGDDNLDNNNLMRFAGRFSRRIRANTQKLGIPLLEAKKDDRQHEMAEEHLPDDPSFQGVFCITCNRAPAPVWDIKRFDNGGIDIRRKQPYPYVKQYSFHIMDLEWGHITIKICPHPPFTAQIMLNGHHFIANQAKNKKIHFIKEDNCFTEVDDAAGLAGVADTMKAKGFEGHLVQVCERWLYSSCLCFALTLEEQKRSEFKYSYSVYQCEYSRNLIFSRGNVMDRIYNGVVDRTRSFLDAKRVVTIFGSKNRPFKRLRKKFRFELVVEKPVYDMTVFKVHFGKLTVKIYSKGEHVLRIEAVAHNTKELKCGKRIERFSSIVEALMQILNRFLNVLRCMDVSLIHSGRIDTLDLSSKVGATKVGGVNINRPRMRAVMKAVIMLSANPNGFMASCIAEKVREIMQVSEEDYTPRKASYDLKKLRGKNLVCRIEKSRRYQHTEPGLNIMAGLLVLRDKVLIPLLDSDVDQSHFNQQVNPLDIDSHYHNIRNEMKQILSIVGIAA
jgi:DNA-binding transcriptional ArsR family regulator